MADHGKSRSATPIRSSICVKCQKILRKTEQYSKAARIISSREDARDFGSTYDIFVQENDVICSKCFTNLRVARSRKLRSDKDRDHSAEPSGIPQIVIPPRPEQHDDNLGVVSSSESSDLISSQSQNSTASEYVEVEPINVPMVSMNFDRVIISKRFCFICHGNTNLVDVPFQTRMQVFQKKRIFIPKRNRCCVKHIIGKFLYEDELDVIRIHSRECEIEVSEVKRFLDKLSEDVDRRVIDKIGMMKMSDQRVKSLTGHLWVEIVELREMMATMRDSENRNVLQALVIFLFKMRTGNSDLTISSTMEVTEKVVNDSIHSVLNCFEHVVLPKNFGVTAFSREFFVQQSAPISDMLHGCFPDRLRLICDGTYLRHEKSSNNAYQRKSYSGQKKTPLCKPFTICTTNGFTVDAPGPFNGNVNDAAILRKVLEDPNGISSILKPGDQFILDRGFRDVIPYLEEKGYTVLMPALKGKRNQLTAAESNNSRFVTVLRWVVEAIHGILGQKYRLLHHQFRNNMLHDAGTYTRIAYFLLNKFGKRLNVANEKMHMIVDRMKSQNHEFNELAIEIEDSNLNRKTVPFQSISSSDLLDFPRLELEDLQLLFTGSYQLGQAISYLGEMLDEQGNLALKFLKDRPEIVRFEVRSRHVNAKTYKCYVKFVVDGCGIDAIQGYCCNCANGLRTIGCCSHVASLIYHLSYGRYQSKIFRPAEALSNLFDLNNCCPVINDDSDED